ncbi:hypothetical protein BDB00DRAFT_933761 [Zychaea mexicana]|uniref:uncharacterized protein n=1 Tax=Zychaea mexicana TaxID=64656 RepID=UPI0022FEA9B8|nr:uncharacterized protein BDB00DRAFT_933761 [Zychaea mexicana]KAI9484330.1 hypothetical protein BDB00DRAFT_933761 [Zychaea mexicana]
METNFFDEFQKRAVPPSADIELGLQDWIYFIRNYVTENQQAANTIRCPLNNQALEAILDQGRPRIVLGHTILALVGHDSPQELDTNIFPFVNLYPWYGKENTFDGAISQLRRYFYATRPLIAVTFSRTVTKTALGNFYFKHGILNTQFLDVVGIPTLQTFATEEWLHDGEQQAPPQGTSNVIIPSFDPGRDKYDEQLPEMRRLMDITWMITILVAEYAMNIATPLPQDHDNICRIQHQRSSQITLPTTTRQRIASETMAQHGKAEGEPESAERRQQVCMLLKKNDRCLHMHIDRNNETLWREWAMSVPKNICYLASAMNLAALNISGRDPLYNILRQFAPPSATNCVYHTNNDWMHDAALHTEALTSWGKRTAIGRVGLSLEGEERQRHVSQLQRRRCVGDDSKLDLFEYLSVLVGQDVSVRENGAIALQWLDPQY